jgi:hypothetical protein
MIEAASTCGAYEHFYRAAWHNEPYRPDDGSYIDDETKCFCVQAEHLKVMLQIPDVAILCSLKASVNIFVNSKENWKL